MPLIAAVKATVLTAHMITNIELYCSEKRIVDILECKNDLIQCVSDDIYTLDECTEEYDSMLYCEVNQCL